MTKRKWEHDERGIGGYADWDEVVKTVDEIKKDFPEAKDIVIVASPIYDGATNYVQFKRYQTNEEIEKERLRIHQAEEHERQQYLKLKAKFENNKGNG